MPKMRLGWYAGVSTALAGSVVLSAFHQRANFYSAMVYLAQSNFCLLVLVNFTLILYSSFIYGLTRIFFGPLRAIEVEQLTERAWFAITETCLAMTIFREEIGAWFLVMFTALVTGKVWGWIGEGRVEIFEQQPPANPRLFHLRLVVSLSISLLYDFYILRFTINTVIQQARPNMMVMFLFEFALLATSSWRTTARYGLSITEMHISETQKRKHLAERREEVRERRERMTREREAAAAAGEEVSEEPLPNEDDIDEMDIEVAGWTSKGEWMLWLDVLTDLFKLGIYVAFFMMLLTFYGLPIHIMRDLFMTCRDFIRRLNALWRYRRAIQELNRYPDATTEDLAREDTCIICREEMRFWETVENTDALDRVRPKKLPCGHILHLGCLKSWLERQQVCPTCRRPVAMDGGRAGENRAGGNRVAGLRLQLGGRRERAARQGQGEQQPQQQPQQQQAPGNLPGQGQQQNGAEAVAQQRRGPRIFQLGPFRFGFGANQHQVQELAQQFGIPQGALNQQNGPQNTAQNVTETGPRRTATSVPRPDAGANLENIRQLLQQTERLIQREVQSLNNTAQELHALTLLTTELHHIRRRNRMQELGQTADSLPATSPGVAVPPPWPLQFPFQMPPSMQMNPMTGFPGLPTVPPRHQSPVMARHSASNYAAAIPAGSPELPDGVIIPNGWSLLPLQRMDGPPHSMQPSPQEAHESANAESSTLNPPPSAAPQSAATAGGPFDIQQARPSSMASFEENAGAHPTQTAPFTQTYTPPPPVVSPSPRMPNWGGSAQLFNSSAPLDQADTAPQTASTSEAPGESTRNSLISLPTAESSQPAAASQENSTEESSHNENIEEAVAKGKGKAATVEDVEDEDDADDEEEDEDDGDSE